MAAPRKEAEARQTRGYLRKGKLGVASDVYSERGQGERHSREQGEYIFNARIPTDTNPLDSPEAGVAKRSDEGEENLELPQNQKGKASS
jgi:hypothetical protein